MTVMTPMLKVIRRGKAVYSVNMLEDETLVATAPTTDQASWVANAIAGWHKKSLEEIEVESDS